MASHPARWLSGTVEKIVRHSECPVLVRKTSGVGPVIAATDLSDPSLSAIRAGRELAMQLDVPLVVLHVIDYEPMARRGRGWSGGSVRRKHGTGTIETNREGRFVPRLRGRNGARLDPCDTHWEAERVLAAALRRLAQAPAQGGLSLGTRATR